jgi:hypothetical protein
MIFVLRLYKGGIFSGGKGKGVKKVPGTTRNQHDKEIVFTWWTCRGNPIAHAERLAMRGDGKGDGGFAYFDLTQRHYQGLEAGRDYGFGRGHEPIICGAI